MNARRADLRDVFRQGGESVVMAGANVVRLSELATYLLDQLPRWDNSEDLAETVVERFGEPADGSPVALVEDTLSQLANLDIVVVEP